MRLHLPRQGEVAQPRCSSFGSCTSLRHQRRDPGGHHAAGCSSFGSCTSLRRSIFMTDLIEPVGCSSFGSCTSLRRRQCALFHGGDALQFLRELHFIEASGTNRPPFEWLSCSSFGSCTSLRLPSSPAADHIVPRCSSFGSCTSLRQGLSAHVGGYHDLQFLRELHFIEAGPRITTGPWPIRLQFLRELHFIEASSRPRPWTRRPGCSSFGSCTSLRPGVLIDPERTDLVAVPSGAALH